MLNVKSSWHYQQWLIETELDNYLDYKNVVDDIFDNRESTTATNKGLQKYHQSNETKDLENLIRNHAKKVFNEIRAPIKLGELINSWSIEYSPGGWQALHTHGEVFSIVSCVLYWNKSEGEFVSIFTEPDGTTKIHTVNPTPGKLIILSGNLLHGAYPTDDLRQCTVFDFKQVVNKLS